MTIGRQFQCGVRAGKIPAFGPDPCSRLPTPPTELLDEHYRVSHAIWTLLNPISTSVHDEVAVLGVETIEASNRCGQSEQPVIYIEA